MPRSAKAVRVPMHSPCAGSTEPPSPVVLHVADAEWHFSIAEVAKDDGGLFVQILLQGPDECAVTVRVRGGIVVGATAEDMLNSVCEWLLMRGEATEGYIDLSTPRGRSTAS
jgi:hypothetical protein